MSKTKKKAEASTKKMKGKQQVSHIPPSFFLAFLFHFLTFSLFIPFLFSCLPFHFHSFFPILILFVLFYFIPFPSLDKTRKWVGSVRLRTQEQNCFAVIWSASCLVILLLLFFFGGGAGGFDWHWNCVVHIVSQEVEELKLEMEELGREQTNVEEQVSSLWNPRSVPVVKKFFLWPVYTGDFYPIICWCSTSCTESLFPEQMKTIDEAVAKNEESVAKLMDVTKETKVGWRSFITMLCSKPLGRVLLGLFRNENTRNRRNSGLFG